MQHATRNISEPEIWGDKLENNGFEEISKLRTKKNGVDQSVDRWREENTWKKRGLGKAAKQL